MWHDEQPILPNTFSPLRTAFSISGSLGITCPGTAIAAWNKVTAVMSARVNSFLTPSPKDQIRPVYRSGSNEACPWKAFYLAGVPGPIFPARKHAKRNAFGDHRLGFAQLE